MSPLRPRASVAARRISLLTALAAGLALVGLAAPASAHDQLVSSDPAAGSTVVVAPLTISLVFNEDVLDTGAQVVITPESTGANFSQPGHVVGKVVTVPPPPEFLNGTYRVAWRVVSADGHPVEGSFTFTLAAPGGESPTEAASPTPSGTGAAVAVPTETPSAAPTSATNPADSRGAPSGLWLLLAAAVLSAVAVTLAWRRGRGSRVYGPPGQS